MKGGFLRGSAVLLGLAATLLGGCGPESEPSDPPGAPSQGRTTITEAEAAQIRALCATTPTLPTGGGYDGPLVDAHIHTSLGHDQAPFALALLGEMTAGIQRALIQPDHSPDKVRDGGFLRALRSLDLVWGELAGLCDRFEVLVYAFDPDEPRHWPYVRERLATGLYAGIGEIEFQHSRMELRHEPDSPLMARAYRRLSRDRGLLHFQASPRPGREDLPARMVQLARDWPRVGFLWFACPGVGSGWPPNLVCSTVLHEGLPGEGRGQVWGSDLGPAGFPSPAARVLPYGSVTEAAAQARRLLGQLEPDEAARVAYGRFRGLRRAEERP